MGISCITFTLCKPTDTQINGMTGQNRLARRARFAFGMYSVLILTKVFRVLLPSFQPNAVMVSRIGHDRLFQINRSFYVPFSAIQRSCWQRRKINPQNSRRWATPTWQGASRHTYVLQFKICKCINKVSRQSSEHTTHSADVLTQQQTPEAREAKQ
jgi:hypothetical protein